MAEGDLVIAVKGSGSSVRPSERNNIPHLQLPKADKDQKLKLCFSLGT